MKKHILPFVLFLIISCGLSGQESNTMKVKNKHGICFTENKGQVHDQFFRPRTDIWYGVRTGNLAVHIRKSGISYQLYRTERYDTISDGTRYVAQQRIHRIDINWLNHRPDVSRSEGEALPGYSNYYLESCPQGALRARSYNSVTLHGLYEGIDLHYYEKDGALKHDYLVAPHADYRQIRLQVKGAGIRLNGDGSLMLSTSLGEVQEGAPVVFQGSRQLKARWRVNGQVLSFEIENYNAELPLIIDPVTRVWGTYYGDVSEEAGSACATDLFNNVYLAGYSTGGTSTLIATVGSHQSVYAGGIADGTLVKFDGDGNRLWATYYGGSDLELGGSCATDPSGNVYLCGYTRSATGTVIATPGAHQFIYGGGGSTSQDAYLVKFNANGVRIWGTYYGGTGSDFASCTTDKSGNVFLYGSTTSTNAMVTAGAQQTNGGGFLSAGFLVKFNANGVRQWGTYYGTSSTQAIACATDLNDNIFLAGRTQLITHTYIATAASHQSVYAGNTDAFLAKFNPSGVRQWGTYYGGPGGDEAFACATDAGGNVYIAGATTATASGVIATSGSHQSTLGGLWDAMLVKFDPNGTRLWGTYYGGTGNEIIMDCIVDGSGNVYGAGTTSSAGSTVIATASGYQPVFNGGSEDAFLVKFTAGGVRQHATYYGDSGTNDGLSCAVDAGGIVYMCGMTNPGTGTVFGSPGSYQSTFGGGPWDGYLAKFDFCDTPPSVPVAITPSMVCSQRTSLFHATAAAGAGSYTWTLPPGWSTSTNLLPVISVTPGTTGVFTIVTANACGTSPQQTFDIWVPTTPTVSVNSGTICSGKTFTLVPSGASTYSFSTGPVVTPLVTGSYSVTGTSTDGCVSDVAVTTLTVFQTPTVIAGNGGICAGQSFTITTAGAANYTFSSGPVVSPPVTTSYSVTGSSTAGCVSSNTAVVTVIVYNYPTVSLPGGSICAGSAFTLNPTGALSYNYPSGQVVSPATTTSYSVTGFGAGGCAHTAVATVTVFPLPVIQVSSTRSVLCAGEEATLTAGNATSFTFDPGGPGDIHLVMPSENTSYTVQGTDGNGCIGTTVYMQVVDPCTGLNGPSRTDIAVKVFPSPFTDRIHLSAPGSEQLTVFIFNSVGQQVVGETFINSMTIDTQKFADGIYFYELRHANGTIDSGKIMKQ